LFLFLLPAVEEAVVFLLVPPPGTEESTERKKTPHSFLALDFSSLFCFFVVEGKSGTARPSEKTRRFSRGSPFLPREGGKSPHHHDVNMP
jgi:hypothetical protein